MYRRTRSTFLALCIISGIAIAPIVQAQTFDAATQFSATSNPNGDWQYGYRNTLGSSFILDTASTTEGPIDFWEGNIGGVNSLQYPVITHNPTTSTVVLGTPVYQPGQMILHPGPNGQYADLRWVALTTGTFTLNASFIGQDTVGTTTDVHILDDGQSLFSNNINGYLNTESYSDTLSFTQGDILDVLVGYGSNGNYFFDSTGVSLTLSATNAAPEPGGIALVVSSSLMGVGYLRRKRRRN